MALVKTMQQYLGTSLGERLTNNIYQNTPREKSCNEAHQLTRSFISQNPEENSFETTALTNIPPYCYGAIHAQNITRISAVCYEINFQ